MKESVCVGLLGIIEYLQKINLTNEGESVGLCVGFLVGFLVGLVVGGYIIIVFNFYTCDSSRMIVRFADANAGT